MTPVTANVERRATRGALRLLGRHPIVCLLLLTPGIPEYLSGSSSMELLVLNPVVFFLFLLFNLALYGPGVLLIREAKVRWKKGWATVIALGAAYALLEEGLAVDTFFYPGAGPVGNLGSYGHWAGVSWVWVTGIVMVHIVFSISLPILLHGWALPSTRSRSLLSRRGIVVAVIVLVVDVVILQAFVSRQYGFWFGAPILIGSLVTLIVLVGVGALLPATLLVPSTQPSRFPRWTLFVVGLALLPGTFVIEGLHSGAGYFPAITIVSLLAFYSLLLWVARAALGPATNVRGGVAFAGGALGVIMLFGVVSEIRVPIVILGDLAGAAFLWHLWKKYPDEGPPVEVTLPPARVVTAGPP